MDYERLYSYRFRNVDQDRRREVWAEIARYVTERSLASPKRLLDPIRQQTDTFGQAASPFSSFLVLRGVRTLPLRSAKGSGNALAIARFLEKIGADRFVQQHEMVLPISGVAI